MRKSAAAQASGARITCICQPDVQVSPIDLVEAAHKRWQVSGGAQDWQCARPVPAARRLLPQLRASSSLSHAGHTAGAGECMCKDVQDVPATTASAERDARSLCPGAPPHGAQRAARPRRAAPEPAAPPPPRLPVTPQETEPAVNAIPITAWDQARARAHEMGAPGGIPADPPPGYLYGAPRPPQAARFGSVQSTKQGQLVGCPAQPQRAPLCLFAARPRGAPPLCFAADASSTAGQPTSPHCPRNRPPNKPQRPPHRYQGRGRRRGHALHAGLAAV